MCYMFYLMMSIAKTVVSVDYTDRRNQSEKNLSQCHSVHYKSNMDWHGIEPMPVHVERPVTNHVRMGSKCIACQRRS